MKWLFNILDVWLHELVRVLKDEGVLVFFFVVPLLYPPLYAYLYNNEAVKEVPAVVVDNCKTTMSREFLRNVDASADIKIVAHCADMQEAQELIRQHTAYCLIYVPAEFQKNILEGKQSVVELYSDMSGLLYYKAVLSSCTEVSLSMNQDIKAQRLVGATKEQAETFAYPIKYKYVPMFNTQSGFATFLIPAVLIMIIQQTLVLGVGMLMGDEEERRRKGLVLEHIQDKKPLTILLGKSGVYITLYLFVSVYLVCIVPRLFGLIQIWQWQELIAMMFPYILACVFFSIIISTFAKDRESFIVLFVFMSIPMLFMTGISWPGSSIPAVWKALSYAFPSTLGVNAYARISEMGALMEDVRPEIIGLWIQPAVFFVIAWILYRKEYKNNNNA
jgi:ABC-2 type transport system permease protein